MTSSREPHLVAITPVAGIVMCVLLGVGLLGRLEMISAPRDQMAQLKFAPLGAVRRIQSERTLLADLGIQITLPDGWSVLKLKDDFPFAPTFLHRSSGSMIRFHEKPLNTIFDIAALEMGDWNHRFVDYKNIAIDWSDRSFTEDVSLRIENLVGKQKGVLGLEDRMIFIEVMRTGKLTGEFESGLIAEFCDAIEPLQ